MKRDNSQELVITRACLVQFVSATVQQLFFAVFFAILYSGLLKMRSEQLNRVEDVAGNGSLE
jgi:hypothetical protein